MLGRVIEERHFDHSKGDTIIGHLADCQNKLFEFIVLPCLTPSMKQGIYKYILLGHEGDIAAINVATCECAAW